MEKTNFSTFSSKRSILASFRHLDDCLILYFQDLFALLSFC